MDKLPPIPTPVSLVWREFRIQGLPVVVFLAVLAAVVVLWRHVSVGGNSFAGIGEGVRSVVASPQLGLLREVKVQPYQEVEAGEPIATLLPVDPRAQLDLLQSELQLARLRLEPSLADQNAMSFERVRVEWLRLKQELAVAKVNLEGAEKALRRNAALIKDKLVSEDTYDFSLRDRDMYQAEVTEKSRAAAEIEQRLTQLRAVGEPALPGTNHPMLELVDRLELKMARAATNWAPLILTAPISGMVHMVNRQAGEFVLDGEPLFTIHSPRSDRIVGYLRQPYPRDPEVGAEVEVLTRNRQRQKFVSQISQVGAQVEIITNALAFIKQGALVDAGLPIVVAVPPAVNIRPGEMVDIVFRSAGPKRPPPSQDIQRGAFLVPRRP